MDGCGYGVVLAWWLWLCFVFCVCVLCVCVLFLSHAFRLCACVYSSPCRITRRCARRLVISIPGFACYRFVTAGYATLCAYMLCPADCCRSVVSGEI